tara:strand:- start:348 stop:644 length:297 start_codon:yes stop_codon:yes gene_type:complete
MIIAITIIGVLLLVSLYVIWNLLTKVEQLEDSSKELADVLDNAFTAVQFSKEKLQELDTQGIFEADDDIGFFFKGVLDIQEILNSINVNDTTTKEERS